MTPLNGKITGNLILSIVFPLVSESNAMVCRVTDVQVESNNSTTSTANLEMYTKE